MRSYIIHDNSKGEAFVRLTLRVSSMMFTEVPVRKNTKLRIYIYDIYIYNIYIFFFFIHMSYHPIISYHNIVLCISCHSILGYHILSYHISSIFIFSFHPSHQPSTVTQTSASSFADVSGLAVLRAPKIYPKCEAHGFEVPKKNTFLSSKTQ